MVNASSVARMRPDGAKSSHNGEVPEYLSIFVVALVAAGVVIAAAASVTTERFGTGRGARGLRQDARRTWDVVRRRRPMTTPAVSDELERVVTAEPVETTMDDFFAANVTPGTGYLDAEVLVDRVGRVASAAKAAATRTTSSHE